MLKLINWFKKNAVLLLGGLAIFVMFACFVSGCNYHKKRFKCPEITTNTVIIHDTLIHQIVDTFPYYISHTDTVIYTETVIQPVDTAAILRDYFAVHIYDRDWLGMEGNDSILTVSIKDSISQNRSIGNEFTYRILRPQTITNTTQDNSIHYNSYLYGGLDLPLPNLEYASVDVLYAFSRGYLGFGYIPLQKGLSIKGGVKIAKFQ